MEASSEFIQDEKYAFIWAVQKQLLEQKKVQDEISSLLEYIKENFDQEAYPAWSSFKVAMKMIGKDIQGLPHEENRDSMIEDLSEKINSLFQKSQETQKCLRDLKEALKGESSLYLSAKSSSPK